MVGRLCSTVKVGRKNNHCPFKNVGKLKLPVFVFHPNNGFPLGAIGS